MNNDYGIGGLRDSLRSASSAISSIDDGGISSALRSATGITSLASSVKPFTFDNDEVSNRPAAQQWSVCTP